MFKFRKEQKVLEINGLKIGDFPKNPPVMIGTIFYTGHKIVSDAKKGVFDREAAESLIKSQEEFSDKTKIPSMLDVAAESPEAIVKYMDFVASVTDKPFIVDVPSPPIMDAAVKHAVETGLLSKIIVNSLTPRVKDEELKILVENKVKYVVLLLYTDRVIDVRSRIDGLKTLLDKIKDTSIENVLVDTFVIDIPSLSAAMRAITIVKSEYGLPSGCGAHNALSTMAKAFKQKYGKEALHAAELAANIATLVVGADFVMYGPIEAHNKVLPAAYTIYSSYRYLRRREENLIPI